MLVSQLPLPTTILVHQLDQHQSSFNQHKPASWSFQHMCWGEGFCLGFANSRVIWQIESCLAHAHSYGSNLPVLEWLAHAVLKYLA